MGHGGGELYPETDTPLDATERRTIAQWLLNSSAWWVLCAWCRLRWTRARKHWWTLIGTQEGEGTP